jgi:hypothetical protein
MTVDSRSGESPPLYQETQHFRQVWLWALVLFISLLSLYGAFQQLILGEPFGNNPAPDGIMIVLAILFGIGLPLFMCTMNLTTEIRSDGLYFRFFPFHLSFRRIAVEEIKDLKACTYSPIKDYGGWGIRYGRKGKAYNVSGNRGVQFELSSGKRLLIGSRRPEELAEALASILGKR